MLTLDIPAVESFNNETEEFITTPPVTVQMEHSLVSLSKWEQKFQKPFLGDQEKTDEETVEYLRMMCLTPDVPDNVFDYLPPDLSQKISEYIAAPMTATWFNEPPGPKKVGKKEVITSEIIYYWMISLTIPLDFENRHLNHLLTLIKVCNQKNAPEKKMSKKDIAQRNRELNAARRAQMGSQG